MAWFDADAPLLPEVLTRQARWHGRQTALVMDDQRRSWQQFEEATSRIAQALLASGVGRGVSVVLLMTNSLEMIEAIFGVLKAGAAVVPLNTSVPDAALQSMTLDCGARVVVASGEHCARYAALRDVLPGVQLWLSVEPAGAEPAPGWQDFTRWRDSAPATTPAVELRDDDVCNIIYSSGTTGLPKGIVHTHRRRLDWAYDLALALRYHSGCVTLCTLGLYSNISWVSILCTLLAGGRIVVARSFDAEETLALIEREHVTHSSVVPLQLQRLLESPGFRQRDLSSLQSVMCCGSPLPLVVKQRVIERIGPHLIELYGLTEGVITTLAPEELGAKLASVGKPVQGTDLRIIDEQGRELPAGASGEIVSRGRILMSGYHGRDDANAESTWTDAGGRKWLRTGDIGRLDDDGFLYIVDRAKDMIISGGQNIYPADIEAVLLTHPQVAEVAVVGVPSERWGESPLALVVARAGTAVDAATLCAWTNERVGRQQRLCGLLFRDNLPRNPNGKILKRELRREYANFQGAA